MHKWDRFLGLTGPEQIWLLQAWALLPLIRLILRLAGYRRTMACLQRFSPRLPGLHPASAAMDDLEKQRLAARLGWLTSAAANHSLLAVACLPRAIALWWMLRRADLAADLRIGVRKNADALSAHAWVEYAGAPLGDPASKDFSPILSSIRPMEGGLR